MGVRAHVNFLFGYGLLVLMAMLTLISTTCCTSAPRRWLHTQLACSVPRARRPQQARPARVHLFVFIL